MDNPALLSPADVRVIRRYVQSKYVPLTEARRAEIVATAIRETLQRRLPELPPELKVRMADELIRQCLLREQRDIRPDDVLDACSRIELSDPSEEYRILDPVLRWMNERSPGAWNPEMLTLRLFGRTADAMGMSEAAAASEAQLPALSASAEGALPAVWKRILLRFPRKARYLIAAVLAGGVLTGMLAGRLSYMELTDPAPALPPVVLPAPSADIGMPAAFRFRNIDEAAVKRFLQSRDSMLAEEPYFEAIVESGRLHDVNPLLLFAITGQEQGFVPKSNRNAKKIANNPFNVYHSWEEFNTDIAHSSDIAARTVSRRGNKRPEGHEPFRWLNMTYAEDKNWANGVQKIFEQMEQLK